MTNLAMNLETETSAPSSGGRLVAPDGRTLPLRGSRLSASAVGGVARVVLTQRFVNPFEEPLRVTYLLPLPSDGAVAGFSFRIGEKRIVGEVDRREAARERFEQALVEGRTAAILEQDRSSLFTQEVGNIPARAEVEVEIELDQRLRWLDDGAWEWRFPTVVGARYQGGPGRVADAERTTVDVSERGLPARVGLELSIGDRVSGVESTSHRLIVDRGDRTRVTLEDGAALDRDVVVRWQTAALDVGVSLVVARPASPAHDGASYGLLTLVPPNAPARAAVRRDLIFLIDVSGSMSGEPLDQVKRIAGAMIDTLGDEDRVELIAFGSAPVRFAKEPLAATRDGKRAALQWLRALRASGATEMTRAVIEALAPLRPSSQRQVVLMTDGYIGFERELVREVLERLPEGARLHTVGVGSAVNRTLTQWAARAGGGVEIIAGLGEDPERVAKRLLARTTRPMVTDVRLEGSAVRAVAPSRVPDLYAGSPSLVSLALAPDGGTLVVRGKTAEGDFEQRLEVPATALGEGLPSVATLFGRERVEDLETEGAASGDGSVDREIEAVGLKFRIATRMTSWVAVSDDVTVDPDEEKRAVRQPHEVPHGVSIEGLGLRAPQAMSMTLAGGGSAYAASTMAGVLKMPFPGAPPAAAPMGAAPPARRRATAAPTPRSMQAPPPSPSFAAAPPPPRTEALIADEEVSDGFVEGAAPLAAQDRPDVPKGLRAAEERAPEPAAPAEQPAPAKAPRSWIWIVLAIVIAVAIAIAAWLAIASAAAPEPTLPQPTEPRARE